MKTKQSPKPPAKAQKPTSKSGVQNLPVNVRQAKDIKAGAYKSGR